MKKLPIGKWVWLVEILIFGLEERVVSWEESGGKEVWLVDMMMFELEE